MYYGWGKTSRDWDMNDGRKVVASSKYFSIAFIPLILNTKWSIIGDRRSEDEHVTRKEVEQVYGVDAPSINIFSRFGLIFAGGGLIVLALLYGAYESFFL